MFLGKTKTMNPIHKCKIHCHTMDPDQADLMGMEDRGKWLSFAIHMDVVTAVKLSTDDEDQPIFGCTTLFTELGESYIIDTPYEEFLDIFYAYHQTIEPPKREASL